MIRDMEVGNRSGEAVLDEYMELRAMISRCEERLDELKPAIIEAVMDEDKEEYRYKGFRFVNRTRRAWEYTDDVEAIELDIAEKRKELSTMKRFQEAHGLAVQQTAAAYLVMEKDPQYQGQAAYCPQRAG